jgi:hypothetical protein
MTEEWAKTADGNIQCYPLIGWAIQTAPMMAIVRLPYVTSEAQLNAGKTEALQLAIGGPQLRELAQALSRAADAIDEQPLGTQQ